MSRRGLLQLLLAVLLLPSQPFFLPHPSSHQCRACPPPLFTSSSSPSASTAGRTPKIGDFVATPDLWGTKEEVVVGEVVDIYGVTSAGEVR